jgi:aspartate 1-decarboxylase
MISEYIMLECVQIFLEYGVRGRAAHRAHQGDRVALSRCATSCLMSDFTLLKSKLHRATVTGASLHYEGSLTVAEELAKKAGFLPYEKILVGNINNGERFETYLIFGMRGDEGD